MPGSMPKRKGSSSNNQFSGGKMLVSEKVFLVLRGRGVEKRWRNPAGNHTPVFEEILLAMQPPIRQWIYCSLSSSRNWFWEMGNWHNWRPTLLGGWSSKPWKKYSTKTQTLHKPVKQNCLEYVYAFQKRLAIWQKNTSLQNFNTRSFKPWPFYPILGGHLAIERVT